MGLINEKELKKLCMKNGRFCAICHTNLIIKNDAMNPDTIIAEIAHIRGKQPGSPRYDNSMTQKERNSSDNLILLCPNCHKKVDYQEEVYTVEKLTIIREDYEGWIIERTQNAIVEMTFAELEVVTKYLVSGQAIGSDSLTIIPPKEKIKRNGLSPKVEGLVRLGMTQVKQVEEYIERSPDIEFGERLKEGFVVQYERLKNIEKYQGDDLFNSLLDSVTGGTSNFSKRAAGLSVLVYLFEKCEVFEK